MSRETRPTFYIKYLRREWYTVAMKNSLKQNCIFKKVGPGGSFTKFASLLSKN
jgi:hypothetical protein